MTPSSRSLTGGCLTTRQGVTSVTMKGHSVLIVGSSRKCVVAIVGGTM